MFLVDRLVATQDKTRTITFDAGSMSGDWKNKHENRA